MRPELRLCGDAMPLITLLTDFGNRDAFVGIVKGVILGICPPARIVDLTHEIPPQQIVPGALLLRSAVPYFPPGTVHVAVVDPGVGSDRRALVIECERGVLVGPDNGILSLAADILGAKLAVAIDTGRVTRQPISNTFHGRDVFAPVAAQLAAGVAPTQLGHRVAAWEQLTLPVAKSGDSGVEGEVLYVDHFGNLVTNIDAEQVSRFFGRELSVSIAGTHVRGLVGSYAEVPVGTPLAILGSWGALEVAVRNGNAAQHFAARPGTHVKVVGGVGQS